MFGGIQTTYKIQKKDLFLNYQHVLGTEFDLNSHFLILFNRFKIVFTHNQQLSA